MKCNAMQCHVGFTKARPARTNAELACTPDELASLAEQAFVAPCWVVGPASSGTPGTCRSASSRGAPSNVRPQLEHLAGLEGAALLRVVKGVPRLPARAEARASIQSVQLGLR